MATQFKHSYKEFVADALRAKAADYFQMPVEFALTNYGGIRIPMPEGAVTLDDIESMFPFKNYMCPST